MTISYKLVEIGSSPPESSFQSKQMPQKDGYPKSSCFQRRPNRENAEAIKAALRYKKRSTPELLDYQSTYRSVIPKKARLAAALLDSDTETDTSLTPLVSSRRRSQDAFSERAPSPAPSFAGSGSVAKRRVLVDLEAEAFGASGALQTPLEKTEVKSLMEVKMEVGASGTPVTAAEPSASVAARAKKRRREVGKAVVGEASQDPAEDDAFEKWEPPIAHKGRPISTSDSVVASQDFAFDLTKFLLTPVDMADYNGPRDIPILKGTLQMMTACIQRMHLSITRAEELERAMLEAAMNVERLTVNLESEKEGRRTVEREAFHLNKIVASAEQSKEAAIGTQAQLEGKVTELEAVIAVMAAERTTLEAKHWQQGGDEAGATYKEEVLVLRDKLFVKGWMSALAATMVPEGSFLYHDVLVPSRSLGLKTISTPAVLPDDVSPEDDFTSKAQSMNVVAETVNVEGVETLETEATGDVVKVAPASQEVGASPTFPLADGLDKIADVAPELPTVDEN